MQKDDSCCTCGNTPMLVKFYLTFDCTVINGDENIITYSTLLLKNIVGILTLTAFEHKCLIGHLFPSFLQQLWKLLT